VMQAYEDRRNMQLQRNGRLSLFELEWEHAQRGAAEIVREWASP
jgi:hypothetical protein